MALHTLPDELLGEIMYALDSPRDLVSLIAASAPCWRVYSAMPRLFVASVLKNAIMPTATHSALALLSAPSATCEDPDMLAAFLDRHFEGGRYPFPTDMETLKELCRIYNRTCFFIDDYASRAMFTASACALGMDQSSWTVKPVPSLEDQGVPGLSKTERLRFQRAFLTWEVYCRAFPPGTSGYGPRERPPFFSPGGRAHHFLSYLEPWAVEEMSCVHHYFMLVATAAYKHVERQLVEAALARPGVCRSDIQEPWIPMDQMRPDDMVSFYAMDISNLSAFSTDYRPIRFDFGGYVASRGQSFMYSLMTADADARREIVRRVHVPRAHSTFGAAIRAYRGLPGPGFDTADDTGIPNDTDLPCIGSGFFRFVFDHDYGNYSDFANVVPEPRQERAFVFWDAARIASDTELARSLQNATIPRGPSSYVNMSVMNAKREHPSAEERLQGIHLPRKEMKWLEGLFGNPDEGP